MRGRRQPETDNLTLLNEECEWETHNLTVSCFLTFFFKIQKSVLSTFLYLPCLMKMSIQSRIQRTVPFFYHTYKNWIYLQKIQFINIFIVKQLNNLFLFEKIKNISLSFFDIIIRNLMVLGRLIYYRRWWTALTLSIRFWKDKRCGLNWL